MAEHSNKDSKITMDRELIPCPSEIIIIIGGVEYNLVPKSNTYTSKDNLVSGSNVASPIPLFKDYLGNDVFKGDKFWFVEHNFEIGEAEPACSSSGRYSERKYFKEKLAAHQYVSENKPSFSIKDFKDTLEKFDYAIDMMEDVFSNLKYFGKLNDKNG